MLFSQHPGWTQITQHVIDTGNASPAKVRTTMSHSFSPIWPSPVKNMAQEGIIRPSSSPECVSTVYVSKSNEEIRIYIDFVQLNRVTKKDSYSVPRGRSNSSAVGRKKVFSKLDLRSAYWQFPMHPSSIEKTTFSPGPRYGLWEFLVMPYGLTGATQTCQHALD